MNDLRESEVEEVLERERAGSGNYFQDPPKPKPLIKRSPEWNRYVFHAGRQHDS